MRHESFAVFILSHGRPDNVVTLKTLLRQGYTGRWYIVIDNEDKTADEYYARYGENVIMFDKLAISKTFDTADNFQDRRTVVYARNACFDIAERMGIEYFLECDDDYSQFTIRWPENGKLRGRETPDLEYSFDLMLDFLDDTGALTVAFSQAGDLLGGAQSPYWRRRIIRKAMNTFFCKTSRRFQWLGRINEDVNTYVTLGGRGNLFFTLIDLSMTQGVTQQNAGGMSDVYLASGTYLKSFYTVMFAPSCTCVQPMGNEHMRLHHHVKWNNAVPKIISEDWRKEL